MNALGFLGVALIVFAIYRAVRDIERELAGIREELARLRKMVP